MIAAHRWQIEESMAIVRQEMNLLGQVHLPPLFCSFRLYGFLGNQNVVQVRLHSGILVATGCCLAQIDQPGSAIDAYISGLRDVLERKASNIAQLQGRLASFQAQLRDEEELSAAINAKMHLRKADAR